MAFSFSPAQSTTPDSTSESAHLVSAAQKMGQLFIDKKYAEYIKYVHPKIIKMIGGPDKMVETLKKSIKQTEDEGFTFNNVTFGAPSKIIHTNVDLQAVVPQIIELKAKNGRLVSTSYLLAISNDKGKGWSFVDSSNKTLEQLKSVLPSLSNDLVIPKRNQPVFYND
ncbi:MAG: hypothetical protein DI539_19435 [Flavobacterium psychrophilum]|nr:MAG: hypothetical protein DI539_19435 [Flavobacterium psychrophilum]